jgi:hypothetical protein
MRSSSGSRSNSHINVHGAAAGAVAAAPAALQLDRQVHWAVVCRSLDAAAVKAMATLQSTGRQLQQQECCH